MFEDECRFVELLLVVELKQFVFIRRIRILSLNGVHVLVARVSVVAGYRERRVDLVLFQFLLH